eukprot:5267990-Amphidinium_carterae.1
MEVKKGFLIAAPTDSALETAGLREPSAFCSAWQCVQLVRSDPQTSFEEPPSTRQRNRVPTDRSKI